MRMLCRKAGRVRTALVSNGAAVDWETPAVPPRKCALGSLVSTCDQTQPVWCVQN
jgi:hypothetical protein